MERSSSLKNYLSAMDYGKQRQKMERRRFDEKPGVSSNLSERSTSMRSTDERFYHLEKDMAHIVLFYAS